MYGVSAVQYARRTTYGTDLGIRPTWRPARMMVLAEVDLADAAALVRNMYK